MNSRNASSLLLGISLLGACGAWCVASSGDLHPPAGPITPSMKTLTDCEPRIAINALNTPGDKHALFRISRPGTYYLTGDVHGVAGLGGIEVASDNVVIDLMGHTLRGVSGSVHGISATSSRFRSIVVRNGAIREWGGHGVAFADVFRGVSATLEELRVTSNSGAGIATGPDSRITECSAHQNSGGGIIAGFRSVVDRCAARANAGAGIQAFDSCLVRDCTASLNSVAGFTIANHCQVIACAAYENAEHGILAFNHNRIVDCVASSNPMGGILVSEGCLVLDSLCARNGAADDEIGAGIIAWSGSNELDGNLCRHNTYGIFAAGSQNIVHGNAVTGNQTGYFLVASPHGPILNLTSGATPGVNGNAAADALGASDPWANFTY